MAIVVKAGGSSLATPEGFRAVADFVRRHSGREILVVSAPGKRPGAADDVKVTDLLIQCASARKHESASHSDWQTVWGRVKSRFADLANSPGLISPQENRDFWAEVMRVEDYIAHAHLLQHRDGASEGDIALRAQLFVNYVVSRGEYLSAILMAKVVGYECVDATRIIRFDNHSGELCEPLSYDLAWKHLSNVRAVVPGFYGSYVRDPNLVCLFSRGGSDITGAVLARGVHAERYENCTDVPGILAADPRIVGNARPIERLTFREAAALAYMGASVLHSDAVFRLVDKGIPLRVMNVNDEEGGYTDVLDDFPHEKGSIVGVAGKANFVAITISQVMLNTSRGYAERVLHIIAKHGIAVDHFASDIDSFSVIIAESQFSTIDVVGLAKELETAFPRATVSIKKNLAMLAIVGEGMVSAPGTLARITQTLASEKINISYISQATNEMTITIGLDDFELDRAIRALYTDCLTEDSPRHRSMALA